MRTNHDELLRVLARLHIRGMTRQAAAREMHLSVSALNKKLRGASPLHPDELHRLSKLLQPRPKEDTAP